VFTPGAHLPLGVLLILPALETTKLVMVFASVLGRVRHGFSVGPCSAGWAIPG
jgi:hypothetical protein